MARYVDRSDEWLTAGGPDDEVVVSTRARLARNLSGAPFAAHAGQRRLKEVAEKVSEIFGDTPELHDYMRLDLEELGPFERTYLRESHLISREMEKGGSGRLLFVDEGMTNSVMVNEEDHLRLCTLQAGYRLNECYERLQGFERTLEARLPIAFTEEFGYLTACPTNTGTGLRLSVMVHLPALAMTQQVDDSLSRLSDYGLVVRGSDGENSEHMGELFQISNEVTLGKSEGELIEMLDRVVQHVIRSERNARQALMEHAALRVEDAVCRAIGVLATARSIDSAEASSLLSRTRLAVGRDWGMPLNHARLNRLFIDIQPAHVHLKASNVPSEDRDMVRASMLRSVFGGAGPEVN